MDSLFILFIMPAVISVFWTIEYLIDNKLLNEDNFMPGALLIMSSLFGLILVTIIYFVAPESITAIKTNLKEVIFLIAAGFSYVAWVGCYLFAQKDEEPLQVAPYLQLAPIIVFVIEWWFLGILPTDHQILGCGLILTGGFILSLDLKEMRFRSNVAILMITAASLIAVNCVLFDFAAQKMNYGYWTPVFWQYVGMTIAGISIYFIVPKFRKEFISMLKGKKGGKAFLWNTLNEASESIVHLVLFYALIVGQNTVVTSVSSAVEPISLFFGCVVLALATKIGSKFNKNIKPVRWESLESHRLTTTIGALVMFFIGGTYIAFTDEGVQDLFQKLLVSFVE